LANNCIEGVYKNLWSECSFFEKWVVEGYILFYDINEFLPILCTFFLNEIHDNRSAYSYILLLSIYEFLEKQLREDHPCLMDISYIIFMHGHSDVCMKNVCAVLYVYRHLMVKFMSTWPVLSNIYIPYLHCCIPRPQKFSCHDKWIDPCRTEMALAF
jgi:hypothetical protein